MSDRERNIVPSQGGGMLRELGVRMKLILRLMRDSRVNPLLKLLPVGTLVYLIVPDLAIGPIDDAVVIWLGSVLFVELCPPDVVKEHMDALHSVVDAEWREAETHLSDCDYCRRRYRFEESLRRYVRTSSLERMPPGLMDKLAELRGLDATA